MPTASPWFERRPPRVLARLRTGRREFDAFFYDDRLVLSRVPGLVVGGWLGRRLRAASNSPRIRPLVGLSADEVAAADAANRMVLYRDIDELEVRRDVGRARLTLREHDGTATPFTWWAVNDPGTDPAEVVRLSVGYAARVAHPSSVLRWVAMLVAAVVAVAAGWTLRGAAGLASDKPDQGAGHAERACQLFRDAGQPATPAGYRSVLDRAGQEMDAAAVADGRYAAAALAIRWLSGAMLPGTSQSDVDQHSTVVADACRKSRLSA